MPTIEVDLEVWCSCGDRFCNQSESMNIPRLKGIIVEPCWYCLVKAKDAGYAEGYDRGLEDGRKEAE